MGVTIVKTVSTFTITMIKWYFYNNETIENTL